MAKIKIYCVTNVELKYLEKLNLNLAGVGNKKFKKKYISCLSGKNIQSKERNYSELTFHYWFWKNVFPKIEDNTWIGFCAYREYWGNKKKVKQDSKVEDVVIKEIPDEWQNFDTIIGEHFYVDNLRFSKLLKHGLLSLARNPLAIIKSKRNIRFHFDMWHGNGNLDKAIDLLDEQDREDFRKFTRKNVSFNRGNMFVCRSKKIINDYYNSIFPWLQRCEKIFGFDLDGYGMTRIYAFLAERYLSYWFTKYTKPLLWPVVFFDINK